MENITEKQQKELKWLFKKHKKLIRNYHHTANFKEPVVLLMRRNRKINFFENCTKTDYTYKHSDGSERKIMLDGRPYTFKYGGKEFLGYILHEDHSTPLPGTPVLTTEMVGILTEKNLNDLKKWKVAEERAKGMKWYHAAIGIAIVIMALAAYQSMTGQSITEIAKKPTTIKDASLTLALLIKTTWIKKFGEKKW